MSKLLLTTFVFIFTFSNSLFAQSGKNLSPKEFAAATMNNPRVQLIDVRSPGEFNSGHIYDADNIDVSDRKFNIEIQELKKNTPTYVYCESGNRSTKAMNALLEAGFTRVYNLDGGMKAWRKENIPTQNAGELSNLTMDEFNNLVSADEKVLVDFTATWCGPCKILKPRVEQLAGQVKIIYIDVDKNRALANEFKINSIPHLQFYKGGKLAKKSTGLLSSDQLERLIR